MRDRIAMCIHVLIVTSVGSAFPVVAHAQPSPEAEISCDTPDALQSALTMAPSGGRIIIRSGICTGTFALNRDIRIQGSGFDQVTLRAADPSQPVVTVPRGSTTTISGVTIAGGHVGILVSGRASLAFASVSENISGGIEVRDNGTFEADKVRITRNRGPGLSVIKAGATVRGGLIQHNVSSGEGGAGLLVVGGRVQLIGTQIEENDAVRDGGGMLVLQKSSLVLERVRLFRNTTRTGHGGAIAVSGSTAAMTGTSIFDNVADAGNGGGIAVLNGGDITVNNTTVASNVASFQSADWPGGWGGGLYVDKSSKAALVHATIVLNTARFAAGIASNNTVSVLASLLSANLGAIKPGECGGTGRIESKGWNLLMELGECRFMSRAGDLMGATPRLGPPGLYGGAWYTVPLRAGSPAIDRIPIQFCSAGLDQRLKPRPANGHCDVGAFERQPDDVMP